MFSGNARWLARLALCLVWLSASGVVNSVPTRAAGDWLYRMPIDITQAGPEAVSDFQVQLVLTVETFRFSLAQADLGDLRFTDASGTRHVPHWVQSFDGAQAVVWIKVPKLESRIATRVYLYFGNPTVDGVSSGYRTFDFFDDFRAAGPSYFALGPPATISQKDQPWETQAPHTLSVVELNRDGYRFWGYYGLADCGGIGVMRSNDLAAWTKVPTPLLNAEGERWPSAHVSGGIVHLVYDRDHCGDSHVVLRSSADPLNFAEPYQTLVAPEKGVRNQNPHLFWNPNDNRYYLYWYRGGEQLGRWQIKARQAETPAGLANSASERVLLDVPYTLAAPNMLYHAGVYYLSTEVNENAWKTKIYAGASPLGPFTELPGDIVLSNNEACWFQHVFDGVLHGFYCKDTRGDGQGWVLQHRVGDLSKRQITGALDPTFWTVISGEWRIGPARAGTGQAVSGSAAGILQSNIPAGPEKVVEADGQDPIVEAGRLRLVGKTGAQFDNVRIRKRAETAPSVLFGEKTMRSGLGAAWLSDDAQTIGTTFPSNLGVFWLFGALALCVSGVVLGAFSSRKTARDRQT